MDYISIYLDESGDLGFDFDNIGTPRYFIITLLQCKTRKSVELIQQAVKKTLKNKLKAKKKRTNELKGTGTNLNIKKYFYKYLSHLNDWQLYAIVLDKHELEKKSRWLPSEQRIYNHLAKEALKAINLSGIKNNVLLVVDKRKSKGINEFNKYLSTHLEATLPLNISFDITHLQSHNDLLLQAVDLFCYGVWRRYQCKDNSWFNVYKDRVKLIEFDAFTDIKKDGP